MKILLEQLSQVVPVILVSGRRLEDLKRRVDIAGIYYAGNHGFEISGPGKFKETFIKDERISRKIKQVYTEIYPLLKDIPRCLIENKIYSLSIHYRLVDSSQINLIEKVIDESIRNHPELKKHLGKKVFEIRPRLPWHKGKAVSYILKNLSLSAKQKIFPIYIGDDITDEDAFAVVKKNGLGILVAETTSATKANYRLRNVAEVYQFLKILEQTIDDVEDANGWIWHYKTYNDKKERLREALFTLSNGYFATRAASEFFSAGRHHYPGTYFAGVYNKLVTVIQGKKILNEDLVNTPNWLRIFVRNNSSNLLKQTIINYEQALNMQQGILTREITLQNAKGKITEVKTARFVSMDNPHLAAIQLTITPKNWSGYLTVQSGVDGAIKNTGVKRYRGLNCQHLTLISCGTIANNQIYLHMRTNTSRIEIAGMVWHRYFVQGKEFYPHKSIKKARNAIFEKVTVKVVKSQSTVIEKFAVFATSKDKAIDECLNYAKLAARIYQHENFKSLLAPHQKNWQQLWKTCDIALNPAGKEQRIIRLHIFHLLQTFTKYSIDLDVGIPARGLHGEAYRGHIFWDELFILPFYAFHFPEIARGILLYRYRRLPMACALAKQEGFEGAMYPWQSASNGEEVTQQFHLNPNDNTWLPDHSRYQRHINGAIVYNIWNYYLITGDEVFLAAYGAEMVLQIARFWASIAKYNHSARRYEILNVVGPDEYHEKYPNSAKPGVHNNAYTNFMAVWCLMKALEILNLLPARRKEELQDALVLKKEELGHWQSIIKKMKIPFQDNGIISQFEGYENLLEFDWDVYSKKYGNIERLDRILKAESDSPDRYKVSKQADVLMLFYLFPYVELKKIFQQLGYGFDQNSLVKNIEYYTKRTSHGSTLSQAIFASVSGLINSNMALNFYYEALRCDITDAQAGTTEEGLHLGAMGIGVQILWQRFAGLKIESNQLSFLPNLPDYIKSLKFKLIFHSQLFFIEIEKHKLTLKVESAASKAVAVIVNHKKYLLQNGKALAIAI